MPKKTGSELVSELRRLSTGKMVYRVRDRKRGSYRIQFETWEKHEAREWFKKESEARPDEYKNWELALVNVKTQQDTVMSEAADWIENKLKEEWLNGNV